MANSNSQVRTIDVHDDMILSDGFQTMTLQEEQVIGFRQVDREGMASAADVTPETSSLSYQIEGRSRQNEEGVERVCGVLIERLNEEGSSFGPPSRPVGKEQGIDCVAWDGNRRLAIQVTRAEPKQAIWKELAAKGATGDTLALSEAVNAIRSLIKEKALRDRHGIVLALDALDTPGHALDAVVQLFRATHGAWVMSDQGSRLCGL